MPWTLNMKEWMDSLAKETRESERNLHFLGKRQEPWAAPVSFHPFLSTAGPQPNTCHTADYGLIGSDSVELGKNSNKIPPDNSIGWSSACECSACDGSFWIPFCNCFVRTLNGVHSFTHSFIHSAPPGSIQNIRRYGRQVTALPSGSVPWGKLGLYSLVYIPSLRWRRVEIRQLKLLVVCPLCWSPHHSLWTGVERSPTVVANWLLC